MDLRKLQSEIEQKQTVEAFEILKSDTNIFYGWTKEQVHKLCEYVKILSYHRNVKVIVKGEPADYFAIILSGKLLIKQEDKSLGYLETGDMIGYMSYLDLPGTKNHIFDVIGEQEGFFAMIRFDDFKNLNKKDPQLGFKLTELMAKKTYNMVNQQFLGEEYYAPFKIKGSQVTNNPKRIKDTIETCPELNDFFNRFEMKDKKNFMKYVEVVDFEPEQKLAIEGQKVDTIFFLMKGELISFKDEKPALFYKPGSILGSIEFFYELSWRENLFGKKKGTLIKLERDSFNDMVATSIQSAISLLKHIVWFQSKTIRDKYEDKPTNGFLATKTTSMLGSARSMNTVNQDPATDFVEYNLSRHIEFMKLRHEQKMESPDSTLKDFMTRKEVFPLYIHSIHESMYSTMASKKEDMKSARSQTVKTLPFSSFLKEKMDQQMADQQKKKAENKRLAKMNALKSGRKEPQAENAGGGPTDEDYEDLKNEFFLLQNENKDLKETINNLVEEAKSLRNEIRRLNEINLISTTKINKNLVHRELLSKDLANNLEGVLNKKYNVKFSSFGDVLDEQYHISKKALRVAKYAYKWLSVVRMRKKRSVE